MLIKERIEEFIEEYKRSRICIETTVRATMNRVMEHEQLYNKDFTEFTKDEVLKMYRDTKAISAVSLQNTNLLLKHAQNWMNYQKGVNDGIYQTITKDELKTCIDINKKNAIMLNKNQIDEIKGELLNDTDKSIISLLFEGVGGEFTKELTFLYPEQVSNIDLCIHFRTGKKINIDENLYDLLQKAFNETEMLSYSSSLIKISRVQSDGLYKLRSNTLYTNSNQYNFTEVERRYRWLQRRLYLFSSYLGLEKLTVNIIQNSGMRFYIQQGMENLGLNFREFVKTEDAKQLARRYDIYSELYKQILIDKFEDYFN